MEEISGKRLNTTAGRVSLDGSSPPYWRGEEGERDMLTGSACFPGGIRHGLFFSRSAPLTLFLSFPIFFPPMTAGEGVFLIVFTEALPYTDLIPLWRTHFSSFSFLSSFPTSRFPQPFLIGSAKLALAGSRSCLSSFRFTFPPISNVLIILMY